MNLKRAVQNFWHLSRPLNVFIAMLTILVAAFISPQFQLNYKLYLAILIAGLMTAGANIINDIYDIEIDRINKPQRPLPSGKATTKEAWTYFVISYSAAFLLSAFCGWAMLVIALVIGLLLIIYSMRLKRTVLWGNLTVSLATAVAFIYGALSVGDWQSGIIPALFAFLFHLGREIIKDMQDLEGDVLNESITFPARYGMKASILLVNSVFILLIVLTFLPYILNVYDDVYFWLVLSGVDLVLVAVSIILWIKNDKAFLGQISHLLKLDMLIGLAAIYLGS